MPRERPAGVLVVVLLAWFGAVAHIAAGVLTLTRVLNPEGVTNETAWIAILVGVTSFALTFSLFTGRNVARLLVTIGYALSFGAAALLLGTHPLNWLAPTLAGVFALIALALLYSPAANEFFLRRGPLRTPIGFDR